MTEQELLQEVIDMVVAWTRLSRSDAYMLTMKIKNLFKQASYVQLNPDQSLPSVRNAVNKSYNDYMLGQEDMLKENFRKVEL